MAAETSPTTGRRYGIAQVAGSPALALLSALNASYEGNKRVIAP